MDTRCAASTPPVLDHATLETGRGPIRVGSQLTYRPFLGGTRTGTVTALFEDGPNGRPGFDLDHMAWGYLAQVVAIHAY